MVKKIAITGVESTGKSVLCKALAKYYNTPFVEEHARQYLHNLSTPYLIKDIENIALQQLNAINAMPSNELVFIDTELYVCKIWSEVVFNDCSLKILNACLSQEVDAFIIPDIDLPWQADDLREAPLLKDRQKLMQYYIEHISATNKPYTIVNGTTSRLEQAIAFVDGIKK